jgi:hypothetical protein
MGMLGYTKRLKAMSDSRWQPIVHSLENSVSTLRSQVIGYEHDIQQLRILCQQFQAESVDMTTAASSHEEDRQRLVLCISLLETTCSELRELLLRNAQSTAADGTQHRERVEALEEELSRCKTQY